MSQEDQACTVSERQLEDRGVDGAPLVSYTLESPEGLCASFVPSAGMVGVSLTWRGDQVLGLRSGLDAYLADAKTFGLPLLAPWANRLGGDTYTVEGTTVSVTGVPGVHRDGNGLPIHGLLAADPGWRVEETGAGDDGARLRAELIFDAHVPQFPAFPFAHTLRIDLVVHDRRLSVTTTVTPRGDRPVPVAFGWHPYFAIPGLPREQWQVQLPFTSALVLDERSLPTGDQEAVEPYEGPLGDRVYDDLFAGVPAGTTAWVAGAGRRVSMTYVDGYPYAVVYAPAGDDLIALEPMTAPTDPFAGHFDVRYAAPGGQYAATFAVQVDDESAATS